MHSPFFSLEFDDLKRLVRPISLNRNASQRFEGRRLDVMTEGRHPAVERSSRLAAPELIEVVGALDIEP